MGLLLNPSEEAKTILEIQGDVETALAYLQELAASLPGVLRPLLKLAPPEGSRAVVSLRHAKTARQVKRNAPAASWSPETGVVSISYVPCRETTRNGDREKRQSRASRHADVEDPARDLVLTLAGAEKDPQLGFVSLKWFRDTYLPRHGFGWADEPENRQQVLVDAINRQWILTSKVPNPKNPQYPVTSIRVNRPLSEVRKILAQEEGSGSPFAPVTIPGERLSETVLRERR